MKILFYFRILSLVFLSAYANLCFGQTKGDYQWIFGSDAEANDGSEGSIVSFSDIGRNLTSQQLAASIGSNNASICDKEGRLLFYTNGCAVFDSTFQVMENGDGLNPGESHNNNCQFGHYTGLQNSIIIPDPGNEYGYYYFHKTIETNDEFETFSNGILHSYISFEESIIGKVVFKNKLIGTPRNMISGYIEAIRHANEKDWWLIDFTEGPDENKYLSYFINEDTVSLSFEKDIENIQSLDRFCASTSQSCFSPDGSKLAKMCSLSGLDLWDFDRSNGQISNYKHLEIPSNYSYCGLGISPNSRFAYLSCQDSLWQVDLWEEDLGVGLELIDTLDKTSDPFTVTNFGYQQLGPDCKIYMNTIRQYDWLHVINRPDEKGKDCDFRQHSIQLPHLNQTGSFPNFPHFRIDEDDVCDSTITNVFDIPIEVIYDLEVFPNPTLDEITVNVPGNINNGILTIKSISGQQLYKQGLLQTREIVISLCEYQNGVYVIELITDSIVYVGKVVKVD